MRNKEKIKRLAERENDFQKSSIRDDAPSLFQRKGLDAKVIEFVIDYAILMKQPIHIQSETFPICPRSTGELRSKR